ncbi:MAG TPA: tetratricopeptide repeat protein [Gemmatimonadales bacterium]|nr:tetratricopeptide repeat protein [Gemmatimonadales bacterium]
MNLEKLKDTARKYEQKEDWRRAIDVYLKAIHEFESGKDQHPDLSLYNRVGDLYMKVNDTAAAVRSYERAADLYTEQGFLNNAIALCGKILRVTPSRTQIYFKLAQIHARKNMVVDAKRHLIEYLDRMNRAGQLDDAFQAVKVFADQFSSNQEIRLMLIELLRAASREEEAKEQLEKLAGDLEASGDRVGAMRTREQIEAIVAGHQESGEEVPPIVSGLVFLDTSTHVVATPPRLTPPPAHVPRTPGAKVPPTPVLHAPPTPVPPTPVPVTAESGMLEVPETPLPDEPAAELQFLDVGAPLDASADASFVEVEPLVEEPRFEDPGVARPEGMLLSDIELNTIESTEVEIVEPVEGFVRIDPGVGEVPAHEGMELMLEPAFDVVEDMEARPLEGLELVSTELEVNGLEGLATDPEASGEDEVVLSFPGAPESEELREVASDGTLDDFSLVQGLPGAPEPATAEPEAAAPEEFTVAGFESIDAASEDVGVEPGQPPEFGVVAGEPWQPTGTSRSVEALEELVLEDPDDPEHHRELGEALLLQGETSRASDEFELALAGYESAGDQERAEALVALLITLQPEDVRYYQRRVEYAYRSGDRDSLLGAYLDLADVLARVQSEDKAIAVYWRVLEHDPENSRAQLALQLLGVLDLEPTAESEGVAMAPQSDQAEAEVEEEHDTALADDSYGAIEAGILDELPHVPAPFIPPMQPVHEEPVARADVTPVQRPLPTPDEFIDLGSLVLEDHGRPRDTRMTGQQVDPTGDEQRDFEEMLTQFKKGIDENVDLDDYQAHYDLGIAFKEMGLYDEAVAEFQRALRAPEGRLRTSEALGVCFYQKGQYAVAEAVLRRAVDTLAGGDEEKIGLIYWLARAAEEQGKVEAARGLYERALAVDIRFQDTNERINRLMTGRQ